MESELHALDKVRQVILAANGGMQVQFTIAQARANRACVVQLAMRPRMRGNGCERRTGGTANSNRPAAVSYTHLTLPTIYSV